MDRFENARDATLAKYRMMQRPKGKLSDGLNLAVDGIATLCMGESASALCSPAARGSITHQTVVLLHAYAASNANLRQQCD
jgi:hypothetical protein